jgi:hypothetical protein
VSEVAWEIAHSIDANASPAFAWSYMTNAANRDDPPVKFELDGHSPPGRAERLGWQGKSLCTGTYEESAQGKCTHLRWRWTEQPCRSTGDSTGSPTGELGSRSTLF